MKATQGGQQVALAALADQIPGLTRHTNYVERRNYTQRRRNASLQRKTSSVPRKDADLQAQVTLERFVYNYCRAHRSLRKLDANCVRKWLPVTPAMALTVTDRVWTLKEALTASTAKRVKPAKAPSPQSRRTLKNPSLVDLKLKDRRDVKILRALRTAREGGLSRSQLCERVQLPRSTVFDRLKILQAKTLVTEELFRTGKPGRPRTLYLSVWSHHSFSERAN